MSILLATLAPLVSPAPWASASAVAVLVPAALVDVRTQRLPDVLVGSAALVSAVVTAISISVGTDEFAPSGIVLGACAMAGPLFVLHLVSPSSMGFGDVKVAVVLGAALGAVDWELALPALALAAGATTAVGVSRPLGHIAFGPGLVGGALVALLASDLLVAR